MHGNRRHIPEVAKQQWVTMSTRGMTSKAIAQVTGSSLRTVNRVLRLSRLTGSVVLQRPVESGRRSGASYDDEHDLHSTTLQYLA
ncbi:hypothetical protein EDD22DRAFT_901746 [Suillus occidentalis]|nr:hypothetical protein EDD22DRAFT_901746 [Suillus occidentalis]